MLDAIDPWTGTHALFGAAAARLGWKAWLVLLVAVAWEILEAAGLGPVGKDPNHVNSLVDVLVAVAVWLCWNHAPRPARA